MPNFLDVSPPVAGRKAAISPAGEVLESPRGTVAAPASAQIPRPLRIVHVIDSIDPKVGGPATVVTRLAAAQAAMGHQVTIVSSVGADRRDPFERAVAGIPGFKRVELQLTETKVSVSGLLSPEVWRRLKQAIAPADAVHLHGVWDMVLLAAARVAKRHGVPYVVRPCGMLDPWSLSQRAWKKKVALGLVFRRMLENAAAVHLLNKTEAELIQPLSLSVPRAIIPNGVFLEEIRGAAGSDGKEFLRQFSALKGQRYILFLARLHHKKGLDLLAGAFARVAADDPEVRLVVAGEDDGARAGFAAAIARAGLGGRVDLVGPLDGAVKYSAYRHAACFCLPSRQEGFSLAVTEALACGVPVAISRATHFPEAALAGAGVEFDLRVGEIAEALRRLLRKAPAERVAMGRAGQRLVKKSFTWPRVASLTVKLYSSIDPRGQGAGATSSGWRQAKKGLIPALRVAALALAWLILGRDFTP